MDILIRKRGVAKSALTRIETYITTLPDQNHADITILDRRLKAFEQCRDDFLLAHQEICCQCDAADLPTHEQELDDFEARLDTVLSTLIDIKKASTPAPSPTLSVASSTSQQPSTSATSQHATADIKLPKLELPTFTGDFQQWLSFHDLFTSTIHSNVKLSGAQKLQYLKASLRDEAAKLLQSMQITDANYAEAWDILTKRYQNKREIVESHLKKLFSQQAITTESAESLRKLLDSTTECIRSLKILGLPTQHWDTIFIHILTAKLDGDSRKQWELSLKSDDLPTWDMFSTYLDQRARALAAVSTSKGTKQAQTQGKYSHPATRSTTKGTAVHLGSTHTPVCPVCSTNHTVYRCPEFLNLSVSKRTQMVKDKHLCFNCLGKGHSITNCISGTCRHCSKKHHTLLHSQHQQKTEVPVPVTTHVASNNAATQVLLSTLQLTIFDKFGKAHTARALLDNAAQSSFISERCVQKCNLNKQRTNVPITGLGAKGVGYSTSIATCKLFNGNQDTHIEVKALVVPVVTSIMPNCKVDHSNWKYLKNLKLADPTFGEPGPIDMLLGADVYSDIVCGPKLMGDKGQPAAMETIFGWVLNGKTTNQSKSPIRVHVANCDVAENLQRFWELEEISSSTNILTTEEKACENHFAANHIRDSTGRYQVRLPFKNTQKPLGDSRGQAVSRLKQIERRFVHKPQLQEQYNEVLQEYLDMGHMELIPTDELDKPVNTTYYMPHHAVIKESSSTTKLRVVFDASATTSTGVSLNDNLMVGPKLQDDILPILIRFRMHPIALTADIAKMYRQFRVKKEDCDYQRIVFRKSSDEPIKDYRLLTATFGTASAPYLAVKCVQQLALNEQANFPLAAPVLQRDLYVDDLMTGANTQAEAITLQDQLLNIMGKGQLELRKWSSNDPTLLERLHPSFRETQLPLTFDTDDSVKTLGLHWNPAKDNFSFKVVLSPWKDNVTKRQLLSDMGKTFDPVGFLAPTLIIPKILFQDLWKQKCDWDEVLPLNILQSWKSFRDELACVQEISIPRCVTFSTANPVQLYGFCDASEKAYAAVVYIRSASENGQITVELLTAKTKVAPTKQETLPRLELCGAALLTRLIESNKSSLEKLVKIESITCFSDSTITLGWIASPPQRWKTFVANRVAQIQNVIPSSQWYYVKSEENPADCASRGIAPSALKDHPLWWHGPNWLQTLKNQELELPANFNGELPEMRKSVITAHIKVDIPLIFNYSSLSKLQRVTALCMRFIHNTIEKDSSKRKYGPLTITEIKDGLHHWIKTVQLHEFNSEINCLKKQKPLSSKSKILKLGPFLDTKGILRVGGRLSNSSCPFNSKHPMLLPRSHQLTSLIIDHFHKAHLHAGPQLLLASLQQNYWIINGRDAVRHHVQKCVICYRQKATMQQQMMADLPTVRANPARPFLKCGVDYAGPFTLRVLKGRGHAKFKAYICLFVCFTTRAIHLELVSDLTTNAFLAALKRFVSRRGKCSDIYSDCGTNFVGANKELNDFLKLTKDVQRNEIISQYLAEDDTTWHFNPPSAPHFGGLWEAGVKSVKYHLKRVVGKAELNFEEMSTMLTQIEACLNSRPLTAMSTDPADLTALTPGHFLVGHPLTAIPEPDFTTVKENRLSRWEFTSRLFQHFWQRWSREYLSRLQQRPKWCSPMANLKVGDLVLIKDENLPPLKWNLGRVTELHPGKDGHIRVVTVKTSTTTLTRPIVKLSLLPIDTSE